MGGGEDSRDLEGSFRGANISDVFAHSLAKLQFWTKYG